MNFFIDGRSLGYFGPGEYLKNLIINLAQVDRENRYIVIIDKNSPIPFSQKNFYFLKIPFSLKLYSPWEQVLIPYLIRRCKPDLAYFPNFNIPLIKYCPYVVTIHDLIYLLYPKDSPSYLSYCYARFMLKRAADISDIIITDSEYSKRDIIHYLDTSREKVVAIPAAVGDCFKPLDKIYARKMVQERYKIKKGFILYVGNHHYHKNIPTLIDAYRSLKERGHYNLVIAGEKSWRTDMLERYVRETGLIGDVIFTGFISPEDLTLLYSASECLVFPSLCEGFGLPPLEAMACGTPVIVSKRASLPEVVGDAAILVDPLDSEEIRMAMENILNYPYLREELIQKGLRQAARFSWKYTSRKLLDIFKAVSHAPRERISKKLHICLVSNEYPPETGWGGVGTYTYNLAQSLSESGHRVYVISRAVGREQTYIDNGVEVHRILNPYIRIPILPRIFRLTYERFTRAFGVYRKIRELDKKYGLDIIEAPEWGAEALFCPGKKLVTRLHTPLWLAYHLNNTPFTLDSRIASLMEKLQCKKSLGLNANSYSLANRLYGFVNRKIEVIYYPFILPEEDDIPEEDYILYFGQLSPRKGVLTLAIALEDVLQEVQDIRVVFAGQDLPFKKKSMKKYIEDLLREYRSRIEFLGHLTKEQLYPVIRKARIIVLPSLWESFGYTCLEALSLGKVVIATQGSGFEEIIEDDGKNGFLVPPEEPLALAQKIKMCLRERYISVKKNARERARFFEAGKIAQQMVDYYMELLNGRDTSYQSSR